MNWRSWPGGPVSRLHSRVLAPLGEARSVPVPAFRPIDELKWLEVSEKRSPQVRRISLRDLG